MNFAVIFAGGIGKRMNGGALPKQFLKLHGKPIIVHTIENFQVNKMINGIVVVCIKEWIDYCKRLIEEYNLFKVLDIVEGGESGQISIFNGLKACNNFSKNERDVVPIHDGVRPIINEKLIDKNIESVLKNGSAVSASKVNESIVLRKEDIIGEVVDREKCWTAKAPQSFILSEVFANSFDAIQKGNKDFIDSASLMQSYGKKLFIVECSSDNIKITTPEDFYIFRAIFEKKENEQLL